MTFNLLSEKIENEALVTLLGGTNGTSDGISTHPHDLVTPVSRSKPYEDNDVDDLS